MMTGLGRAGNCVIYSGFSLVLAAVSLVAEAAPPQIQDLQPRVWQRGTTVAVTVTGSNLDGRCELLMVGPLGKVAAREAGQPNQRQFQVEIPSTARPGVYPLWLVSEKGVSQAAAVWITPFRVQSWSDSIESLPVSLEGRLEGQTILRSAFRARAGQRIVVDVHSRRWGANLRPVVRVLDPRGAQIAYNQGLLAYSGDAHCVVEIPEEGTYTLMLHDLVYRGQAPGYFMVHVGEFPTADTLYPLAIQRGTTKPFRFLGGSLHGQTILVDASQPDVGSYLAVDPQVPDFAGQPFPVRVSSWPESSEEELSGEVRQLPAIPCGVSGCLATARQVDRYRVDVSPNSKLRFELTAERVGSPLDGVLLVMRENGQVLGRGDDQPGTPDPAVELTVPADVASLVIAVEDLLQRGGESFVYHLEVEDVSKPRVDFSIATDRVTIPAGGSALVTVEARRRGFDGPVELIWHGLPPNVRVSGSIVAPGNERALVVLASENSWGGDRVRVQARADDPAVSLGDVLVPDRFRERHHPWNQWFLAVGSGEPAPLRVVWEGSPEDTLKKDHPLEAKVRLERASGVQGKVRLRLVTSQPVPRKKIKENDQEKEVEDRDRMLRLEPEPVLEESVAETVVKIVVPQDLPEHPWAVVLVAELLSQDEKTVVTSSYSDARILGF
jgi:hypothetical protein